MNENKKNKKPKSAFQKSLDLLNYKARSKAELTKRLFEESFPEQEITAALTRLEELGLINEKNLAEHISRKFSHKGDFFITQKLKERGLPQNLYSAAIETIETESERAYKVALKKIEKLKNDDPYKRKQKLYQHLASRGFSGGAIQQALRRLETEQNNTG